MGASPMRTAARRLFALRYHGWPPQLHGRGRPCHQNHRPSNARSYTRKTVKRVLVITTNLQQASFRLRIDALRPLLAQRGVTLDIQIRPKRLLARRRFLRGASRYDAVVLQRKLLDPADARLLRRSSRKIVYDLDDAVMYHAHRVGLLSRWRTRRRFKATAKNVDHVVAGNQYLADHFRKFGLPVTVLPTCVDPAHYRIKQHAATDSIGLVWIGSNSTLPYLSAILPALRKAALHLPGLRLVTIAGDRLQNPGIAYEHVRWSEEKEPEALTHGDIGIAPTPSDRWTLGKCGFKIIQYMAAALPAIASPVGANQEIIKSGETGLLATRDEEWITAIRALASDVELRRRMGRAGRARVEQEYSLTRAADVWASLLS
jgi:glycosyltransferase involved in cell wall biosynthesis